ncbi:T9SS type A sorting domain-containing protein [bacterium]|nr:T9SS type A sorting domain-containing protein [bacterium]
MKNFLALLLILVSTISYSISDPDINRVKSYINEQYPEFGDVQFEISSKTTSKSGIEHIYGVQKFKGMPIFGTEFNLSVFQGELKSFHQNFINISKYELQETAALGPLELVALVVDGYIPERSKLEELGLKWQYTDPEISDQPIEIKASWILNENALIRIYEVSYYFKNHQHWLNFRIDAISGEVYDQDDWVVHCNIDHLSYKNNSIAAVDATEETAETNANSGYRVYPFPVESPNHGSRVLVEDPEDENASPYGWHDVNGSAGAEYTYTRGNNVYAQDDKGGFNTGGSSPDGGSSLIFDNALDTSESPLLYTDAAITNLFYWNNIMHDVWYQYGFDEESGNFQQNNYGKGGLGSDYIFADAQDGSGTNNANFSAPEDGTNGRMQMYIWSENRPDDYFQVNSPSFAAGKYDVVPAQWGANLNTSPVTGDLVLVESSTGTPEEGCDSLANSNEVNGKIALISRGNCNFVQKVLNAQNAGAIGVVVYNNVNGPSFQMGDNGNGNQVTIPAVMIDLNNGTYLKGLLNSQTVSVSLYDSTITDQKQYDSDFDNGVIAHEYGHGISIRLTGGASESSCLRNAEQMGEGWSDFIALVMTHPEGADGSDPRGMGTYLRGEPTSGRGIRPYRYSTNMNVSPYTYDNIKSFSVPHGVGSVWCAMLWDMYWGLIDEYGYDDDIYYGSGGNNIAMQLVIEGMKLQPCSPGFVDGRDAILLADELLYNGRNQRIIWEAFARRGLGYEADQGSTLSRSDGISSFDIPPYIENGILISKRAATEVENGTKLEYTFSVKSYSNETLYNIVLKDTLPERLSLNEQDLNCDNYQIDGQVVTVTIDSLISLDSFVCRISPTVALPNTTEVLISEDFENGLDDWTLQGTTEENRWELNSDSSVSGSNSVFVADIETASDQSLIREVTVNGGNPILSFSHYFNTEPTWDGGVVEIFSNNIWLDAWPYFILGQYNSQIQNNPASALSQRRAYTGTNSGFTPVAIDLSEFKGQTISIRFRFASDAAAGGEGWYIDDVNLSNAVSITNYLSAEFSGDPVRDVQTTFVSGEGIITTGLEEISNSSLVSIVPNPADQYIKIEAENAQSVEIMNVQGQQVLSTSDLSSDINVAHLAEGLYFIRIKLDGAIVTRRVVIQH